MSRNILEPGTAIESQAKGHPATGTEEAGRASQGATHVNESTVGLTNPTGCPPLSHKKPRLLDLFCGAGGCSMGYANAGFVVTGADIAPQPHYPFEFIQGDALAGLRRMIDGGTFQWKSLSLFDAIHASPPCQAYTQAALSQRNAGKEYPDLLGPTRDLLEQTGLPWVIENVPGAPMRADFRICGCQVGLKLRRVRWFETNWGGFTLGHSCHHPEPVVSVVGHGTPSWVREQLGYNPTIADYRAAMGIDWMNRNELSQAIPPAYTELIGAQLLAHVQQEAKAA